MSSTLLLCAKPCTVMTGLVYWHLSDQVPIHLLNCVRQLPETAHSSQLVAGWSRHTDSPQQNSSN